MIVELAPAKINLALHVRARRADGYHEIETLFAFLADGDCVTVTREGGPGLTITGPFAAGLSSGDDNLVNRAATLFAETYGRGGGEAIVLDKQLPVASGIGGGSTDAAATLRALARLHDVGPQDVALFRCAERVGSDVPACLFGRTALGRGRGEVLTALDSPVGTPVLLVNPGVAVSTAAVFARWDSEDRGAIGGGDVMASALAGRNDLEAPARSLAPAIDGVLAALATQPGVILSRMSGSGATCFALFETPDTRAAAARTIQAANPAWWCLESVLA